MSSHKTINLVVFGIGNVGSTFINQVKAAKKRLKEHSNLDIQIPIIANSKLVFFNPEGIECTWESNFEISSTKYKISEIILSIKRKQLENVIVIDATASKDLVNHYNAFVEHGFHIVSANKLGNTLDFNFYKALRDNLKLHNKSFLYETNVGAGLPVIETVKNLYDSGENINRIRGVFSGSLSYVFNTFSSEDESFSKVLKKASHLGLTEPDAREDLSGKDVARKLLILARELDLDVELNNVKIESLVPKVLNGKTTKAQFYERISELDNPFQNRKKELQNHQVLRYVGELDVAKKQLEVKLIAEDRQTPLGQLKGSDSIFEIYTDSYNDRPLVIQGAGAGKEVTARGLFSDIIKIANTI
ncbi:aspartate kinase [uncultured Winogradskyella sp.]|uniref:aspartate kinase n=1 Tax=uncultured Winogradskyella sp. TaxID=395353 RepID=UPI0026133D57|nr:aspartate kinase [uncultured Winogradskyella sp.]